MTGGRDTAGLGGIGGPYRLDAGHDVTQVTQAEKDAVPEEVVSAEVLRAVTAEISFCSLPPKILPSFLLRAVCFYATYGRIYKI